MDLACSQNLVALRRLGFIAVRDERFFGCFCAHALLVGVASAIDDR
jgi:hypothetical protein